MRLLLDCLPRLPAQEAVDRVALLRFAQIELESLTAELVGTVLQPIRPWDERRAARAVAHLVLRVGVEHFALTVCIGAHAAPHLHDHSSLLACGDLELAARWTDRHGATPPGGVIDGYAPGSSAIT